MENTAEDYLDRHEEIALHLDSILDYCGTHIAEHVNEIVLLRQSEIVEHFYAVLLDDEKTSIFLSIEQVRVRLHEEMRKWLCQIFSIKEAADIAAFVKIQRRVGEAHARIHLPIHLFADGIRTIRRRILELITPGALDVDEILNAGEYVTSMLDHARTLLVAAYSVGTERIVRADEAYRLFLLGQNLQVERERQRAVLMEWAHAILVSLYRPPPRLLPPVRSSEFGLWFEHKAVSMFEMAPELEMIHRSMHVVDGDLLPTLTTISATEQPEEFQSLTAALNSEVGAVRYHLTTMLDRYLELENGRDPLTRLLTRRFVPVVLGREIELARDDQERAFAVAMLDVDHFKSVNDNYGHDAGDTVLQKVTEIITGCLRAGDFVFRYGGEEFLLCLTEVDARAARLAVERMRQRIEATPIQLNAERRIHVTVSIGLAVYDGHPDYLQLISKADDALYRAKKAGRNQVA